MMVTKIEIRTGDPSTDVRSFAWPVLQRGDMGFPEGAYAVEVDSGRDRSSFSLTHRVEGAPLIDRLISENKAKYVCAVASPNASYRDIHSSPEPRQKVRWELDDLGAPPLFIPMVVSTEKYSCTLDARTDGVADLWHGKSIRLDKGSRLVLGPVFQLQASLLQLLIFKLDEKLANGQFEVKPNAADGFRFDVHLAKDLFRFLEYKRDPGVRRNIMTHVVGATLALLQRDFAKDDGDEGWKTFGNLKAFADYLRAIDMPVWDEEEFKPERVATALYPHILPHLEDDDE